MKEEVKKLSLIPVVLFSLFSLLFFFITLFFIKKYFNNEIIKIQQNIINYEKKGVKKDVENFKIMFNIFFETSYDIIYFNLENFLKIVIEREIKNFYVTKDNSIIYGDVTNKKLNYEIYKNRYVILDYKNKKYLVFLLDKNKKVYLAGINKKLIDEIILENIKKYLDFINTDNSSYIALGKILTFNPAKNGKFGYLYYMPPKLKEKEGMILSIYKPDSKGNFFRKRYFNCLKENKSCFVSYYDKNPKTGKIEEKISYYSLIKPFNFDVVKGIYASQIREQLKLEIEKIKKIIKKIVVIGFLVYFILLFVFYIYLNMYANKVKNKIFKQYENLIEELKTKHYYDDLTKLPNRNKLIENLKNYKGLILIDIDDFSDINDVYGFFTGNKILKSIANELNEIYKNVYRTGSDEFVIGFNRKIYKTDLCGIANREFQYKFIKLTFTVSGSNEEKVLLKTAESALKLAKKTQKNCILFDKDIEEAQKKRIRLIQKLRKVLENNKIIPFYQCIKGKEEKYESLMRIEMDNKIIPPFMFMDLLKEAKLYNKFSQIMIEKVFNDLKNNKIKNVSINLSYIDIVNEDTRNFIFNLIENCKKNNEITFEILESESIGNFDIVKNFIQFVKNKGIKIAIDDFGSGYSNYIRVLELQPDFIKIDGSLIINISDKKYYEIVRLIVQFAKKFNIATVAEFVENEEIYNILKNIGIDYFQGYYFCKPEPIEKIKI